MAIFLWKWAGRFKNSHMGNPHSKIEFETIWGLAFVHYRGTVFDQKKAVAIAIAG
jgi:hypothetical protein